MRESTVYLLGFLLCTIIGVGIFKKNSAPSLVPPETSRTILEPPPKVASLPEIRVLQPPAEIHESQSADRAAMNSILNASVFIRDEKKLGSGFLISSDGYLLTNSHVTTDMSAPAVTLRDGRHYSATKIREDRQLDVALLKIQAVNLEFLKFGNANALYPGEVVITIGNPGGLSFTVTRGIVSYLGRQVRGIPFIQTDAAINPGNSGGPMINSKFEVVGINSLVSMNEQGISFALPINFVCSSTGLTRGYIDLNPPCEEFRSDPTELRVTAAQGQVPNIYEAEATNLATELRKAEKEVDERANELTQKIKSLNNDLNANSSNLSARENIQSEIEFSSRQLKKLPQRKIEAQIKYTTEFISLLERQRGDSAYAQLETQINQQIDQLNSTKKQLTQNLDAVASGR